MVATTGIPVAATPRPGARTSRARGKAVVAIRGATGATEAAEIAEAEVEAAIASTGTAGGTAGTEAADDAAVPDPQLVVVVVAVARRAVQVEEAVGVVPLWQSNSHHRTHRSY
jgi:hypothetical protein